MSEKNEKIQEKIQHLLALATSPNEHEARSALLKARKLMAKYKVSEHELDDAENQDVKHIQTGVTYTQRRDPWAYSLAYVIAKNHCCETFRMAEKGKQTAEICFAGFETDAMICRNLFIYAVDCIRSVTKELRKDSVKKADGYGFGFTVGLNDAYEKQEKEENWGLVLVVPEKVKQSTSDMKKMPVRNDKMKSSDARSFIRGLKDGHKFHGQKRLKGDENGIRKEDNHIKYDPGSHTQV